MRTTKTPKEIALKNAKILNSLELGKNSYSKNEWSIIFSKNRVQYVWCCLSALVKNGSMRLTESASDNNETLYCFSGNPIYYGSIEQAIVKMKIAAAEKRESRRIEEQKNKKANNPPFQKDADYSIPQLTASEHVEALRSMGYTVTAIKTIEL